MSVDPFSQTPSQFLSGGLVAAKWPTIGFVFEGVVKASKLVQQTDFDDGTPLTWKDGSPRMQLVVDVQSEATGLTWAKIQNIPTPVPNDTGMRAMYVRGNLQKAISQALRNAQAEFENGGHIRVERIADGVAPDPKKNAPHDYVAVWTPPSPTAAAADFLSKPEPDAQQAPAQAAPAPEAPAANPFTAPNGAPF